MKPVKRAPVETIFRWAIFFVLLAVATGWAVKSVLARSSRMKAADSSVQAFSAAAPGSTVKAVVKIDAVTGQSLKATLLEKVSDSVYCKPRSGESGITAVLSSEFSVVMGKAQDIAPGAIVQLAGAVDGHHVVNVTQVVILTGYVHLCR